MPGNLQLIEKISLTADSADKHRNYYFDDDQCHAYVISRLVLHQLQTASHNSIYQPCFFLSSNLYELRIIYFQLPDLIFSTEISVSTDFSRLWYVKNISWRNVEG